MDAEVFRRLQEEDWDTIGKKLLAHAAVRARLYSWRDGAEIQLAAGQALEDIVQEVMRRTISGERHWDPAKGPLEPWLLTQVNSLMDQLAKSAPRRYETRRLDEFDGDAPGETTDGEGRFRTLPVAARTESAEEVVLRTVEAQDGISLLIDAAHGDAELERMVEVILNEGSAKPAKIAASMGAAVDQVYDLMRKLKRRVARKQGAHEAPKEG